MAQRFTAIMAGVGAAACVAACVLLWQFVHDSRDSQAASLAEMRDFDAKLLAGLQRPAEAPPAANSEWAKVRVKLVDEATGNPVAGATGELWGGPPGIAVGGMSSSKAETTNDGVLDFGPIPLGKYQLMIKPPGGLIDLNENILIGPESTVEQTIRVPAVAMRTLERISLKSPTKLYSQLRFLITVRPFAAKVDGHSWGVSRGERRLVVSPDGVVEAVVGGPAGGWSTSGRSGRAYTAVEDPQLPSLPLFVESVGVVQPLDPELLPRLRLNQDGRARGYAAFDLVHRSMNAELRTVAGSLGEEFELEIPDDLWPQVDHAAVRAGLKPPPEGIQVATLVSQATDPNLNAGAFVDVLATFVSAIDGNQRTVRLVEAVEIMSIEDDPESLNPTGYASRKKYSVLLADEESSLLELAKSTHGLVWTFSHTNQELGGDTAGVDPALVESITREVEAAKQATKNDPA